MLNSYDDIVSLKTGEKIIWPFLSGEEILTVEKVSGDMLIFEDSEESLGAEVPLKNLLNYPKIPQFKLGKVAHAPMFRVREGEENGPMQKQRAN